jgi:predicted alpha/beta-fold hydrolase
VKWMSGVTADLLPGYPRPEHPFLTVNELNDFYLTKVWRFGSLERYYNRASAIRFLPSIQVPTLIITSADDPIVPINSFARARFSRTTKLVVTDRGGHLGFLGKNNPPDPDRRWMDWRVVDWVMRAVGRRHTPCAVNNCDGTRSVPSIEDHSPLTNTEIFQ